MADKTKRSGYGTFIDDNNNSNNANSTKIKRVGYGTITEEAAEKSADEAKRQLFEAQKPLFELANELGISPFPKYDAKIDLQKSPSERINDLLSPKKQTAYLLQEIDKKLKESETSRQEILNFDVKANQENLRLIESDFSAVKNVESQISQLKGRQSALKLAIARGSKEFEEELKANEDKVAYLESTLENTWKQYGSRDKLAALVAEKKAELTQKKRLQELLKNNNTAVNDPDFDKYVKNGKETPWTTVGKAIGTSGGPNVSKTTYDDLGAAAWALYKHNNPDAKKDFFDNLDNSVIFEQMKDEEFALLAYYIGKDKETGGNQAETYVELMKETLQTRRGQEIYEKYLKDNTVLQILYGVPAGLDQFANGVTSLFNFTDDYIPASPVQVAGQLAREDLADAGAKVPEWLGGASLGQMAYDTVQTTANMVPSIAATYLVGIINPVAGTAVGAGLMGASAAGNAYQEALNNGWGKAEARTYSTLIGASEALLSATVSKVFGGRLVSEAVENAIKGVTNGFARFALNYGAAFVSEGLEEAAQEVLSPLFENIAFGYNRKGFEDIDWSEVAYSFLLGGLSGGMFETAGSGVKRISSIASVMKEYNTPQKTQKLLKLALSFPTESNANKLATKYNAQVKADGKLSANKVYNLVVATENVLTEKLTKLGENKNAPVIASAALKALTTGQLTAKEKAVLQSSKHGAELLAEINITEEAETPVLQSSANEGDVQLAGVSGSISGANDTSVGASGNNLGVSGQILGTNDTILGTVPQNTETVADNGTKNTADNSGKSRFSLVGYSKKQIENWKNSKNIVVYENEQQLRQFIHDAQNGKNLNKKIYFGAISEEMAFRIKQETGIDVNKYNCTLRASEVRKILKDHGNEQSEALRGQRAITEDDFVMIPQIIQNPDQIILSDELFEGKPVINFVKVINGKTTIAAYVSAKHLDLTVQTMYSGKNKGNLSIAAGEQAPANTPEANAGTVSNDIIDGKPPIVNSSISDSGENYSENAPKRHHTTKAEQDLIKRICQALGIKMKFVHITSKLMAEYGYNFTDDALPDGFYNKEDGTLYIGYTVVDPVKFVFKHELTHFGEGTAQYKKFVEAVDKSKAFKEWLSERYGEKAGTYSPAALEGKVRQQYIDARKAFQPDFGPEDAKVEMMADFVGDCLFNNNAAALERMVSDLDYKERNAVVQYILDFLSYLKRKLAGEQNLVFEITRLENQFNHMLSEAVQTKKATTEGDGVQFSFGVTQREIDKYVDAAYKNENDEDYKPYSEPSERLLNDVSNEIDISEYSHALRDNDIRHIRNSHGELTNEKYPVTSSDIKKIPWIVENYDKVFVKTNSRGKPGIIYVKVTDENVVYYLEAVTEEYHNEKLLVNKQMVKTGIDEIPNLYGLREAINKKESSSQYLADLKEIRKAYVQDVKENYSNDIVPYDEDSVKNNISNSGANNSENGTNNSENKLEFTFSRALDKEKIARAEEIERDEEGKYNWEDYKYMNIWEETGLSRAPSGEWIYEIDDNKMEFFLDGDRFKPSKHKPRKNYLKNYVRHTELFKRYPQLNQTEFVIANISSGAEGQFLPELNCIMLDKTFFETASEEEIKKTLVHEIQHAAQYFDERESGSSVEYWNQRLKLGTMPINPRTGREYTPYEAYRATQGEYEARLSEDRFGKSSKDKKDFNGMPYSGREAVIKLNSEDERRKATLKFSIPTNREYAEAVESGDTQALQQMVDDKAKASGYTERLYHQTGAEFTEFNTDNQKAGKYDWELPTGMFLKPSDNDIGLKGKKQMDLYAKQQNPLEFKDRAEAQQYWRDNVEGYADAADKIIGIDTEYQNKLEVAAQNTRNYLKKWRQNNPGVDSREIYSDAEYQRLNDLEDSIVDEWEAKSDEASLEAKQLIDNYIAESDYDGIVLLNDIGAMGRATKTYIVFDSAQLKDASPITYDDSGNVIPLSDRFDGDKKDIRFSMPNKSLAKNDNIDSGVDNYTEEQYNDFGWVRYNNVLDGKDIKYITQEIQKIKNGNNRGYVLTQYGDYIIPLGDKYNILVYANDNVESPHIRKVLKIDSEDQVLLDSIRSDILNANSAKLSMADDYVKRIYGPENFVEHKKQDFAPFHQYVESERERTIGEASSGQSKTRTNGRNALQQNKGTDRASLNKLAFSMPSILQQARENLDKYERGEMTREEYLEATDELWGKANENQGVLPQGENAQAPIATPKAIAEDKPTERFTRTIIETGKLTDEMLQGIEEKVLLGDFSYKVISDEAATKKAQAAINDGTAEDIWTDAVNDGKRFDKNQLAIGEQLLADAIKDGDTKRVLELSAELADAFTRAGQIVQAARLLKKMTGAGRLVSAQRMVKTLNKDIREKHGDKAKTIEIDAVLAEQLFKAKTAAGVEMVYNDILKNVAEQMPVTFLDKWNAWRYFAMLSNPKTHIRNVVGNAIFVPAVRIKNIIALGIEQSAVKAGALKSSDVTKSLVVKKEYIDFAQNDSKNEEVKQLLKGNKYNDKTFLKENQRIFKNNALEFLTKFNSNALEAEDMLFKNKHYINALAGYLQAKGINLKTVTEDVLTQARIYAVNEARKATFNDESALANWIQNFGNKNFATNLAVEGVLPFKRTPINIVKRGIEYSPIGLTKTLTKGVFDVKKGKITPTEFIDGLASGLTGTGIMLVGMFLASLGCITGGEDDDELSEFEKLLGKQEYAVQILGKSYTIDWAAPSVIPFFIGAEIVNTVSAGEDFSISKIGNAVWNSLEPITNLSMLSGMQGVIESARYAEPSQILASIAGDAITSYAMQAIPSLSGAVSRTIDPTQRSWYVDKNNKTFDAFSQTVANNVASKIPGLSYAQIPKIDAWGREVSRGNVGERVVENFISPGYYSSIEYDQVSEELKRIFVKTGANVFPKTAAKSFQVNNETKHLTADEYVTYAKAKGEFAFDYIYEFINGSAYKGLDDAERTDVIENLYKLANAKAKAEVSDYDLTKQFKTVTNRERNGGSAVDYYIYLAIKK